MSTDERDDNSDMMATIGWHIQKQVNTLVDSIVI